MKMKNPLFVALDVDDAEVALNLAKKLKSHVGGFKLGPRLTYKYGASLISKIAECGSVFIDNKYHDIPSTVIAALKSTFDSGAEFATIHASQGVTALKEFARLERELNNKRPFQILAVTVLTSMNETMLPSNWKTLLLEEHVQLLANDVIEAGLNGIVCSPHEVSNLRKKFPKAFLVTPGIRLTSSQEDGNLKNFNNTEDQSRISTPQLAMKSGSSALVIGRPILEAKDPVEMTLHILNQISEK